jgi:hypothetical protein
VTVDPGREQGREILGLARTWSLMLDTAGDHVPRIVALRERMYAPRPEDFVVDAALLDPEAEYHSLGVGYLVELYEDGSALIRLCDDMTVEKRIEADLVAVPGLGRGWPR